MFFEKAPPEHIKKEKQKARDLRQSQWWKSELAKGICHYCQNPFDAKDLTMDHVLPIVRGGKSAKGNVVVSCKKCNSEKTHKTPVEILLEQMNS